MDEERTVLFQGRVGLFFLSFPVTAVYVACHIPAVSTSCLRPIGQYGVTCACPCLRGKHSLFLAVGNREDPLRVNEDPTADKLARVVEGSLVGMRALVAGLALHQFLVVLCKGCRERV